MEDAAMQIYCGDTAQAQGTASTWGKGARPADTISSCGVAKITAREPLSTKGRTHELPWHAEKITCLIQRPALGPASEDDAKSRRLQVGIRVILHGFGAYARTTDANASCGILSCRVR